MQENRISIVINDVALQNILSAIETIKTNLPDLISLSLEERSTLPKMGDKTLAFVQKTFAYAKQNPDIVPNYIDLDEFQKDLEAVEKLNQTLRPLAKLSEELEDSIMLAGHEAYMAALAIYTAFKAAAKSNVPGMKNIVEDLGERFPRAKKKDK